MLFCEELLFQNACFMCACPQVLRLLPAGAPGRHGHRGWMSLALHRCSVDESCSPLGQRGPVPYVDEFCSPYRARVQALMSVALRLGRRGPVPCMDEFCSLHGAQTAWMSFALRRVVREDCSILDLGAVLSPTGSSRSDHHIWLAVGPV